MIIGGRRTQVESSEWLFAAMALFYDIVMLFVYLLQIIGQLRKAYVNRIHLPRHV